MGEKSAEKGWKQDSFKLGKGQEGREKSRDWKIWNIAAVAKKNRGKNWECSDRILKTFHDRLNMSEKAITVQDSSDRLDEWAIEFPFVNRGSIVDLPTLSKMSLKFIYMIIEYTRLETPEQWTEV